MNTTKTTTNAAREAGHQTVMTPYTGVKVCTCGKLAEDCEMTDSGTEFVPKGTGTPGPWHCNLGNGSNLENDVTIWGPNGVVIGVVGDPDDSAPWTAEMAANAALIAKAWLIPELLAALIELRAACIRNGFESEMANQVLAKASI